MVAAPQSLTNLNVQELCELVNGLLAQTAANSQQIASRDQQITEREQTIATKGREILYRQTKIDQLTHEMAVLKRWKFGRSREQLHAGQVSLLDDTIDADIAAIEEELEQLAPSPKTDTQTRQQPKRASLPPELPRVEHHHEINASTCTTPGTSSGRSKRSMPTSACRSGRQKCARLHRRCMNG